MKQLTEKDMYDIVATDIKWDVDDEEDREELPDEIVVNRVRDDEDISDYLSNETGFCHDGYVIEIRKSISKLAYQLYIIDWKHRNVDHHQMEADVWKNYFMDTEAEDMETYTFNDFLWDAGYGSGTLYVCYEEFLDAEYLDTEYIKELLDNENLFAMYLRDLEIRGIFIEK